MTGSSAMIRVASTDEIDAFFGYDTDVTMLVTYAEVLIEDDMMLAMGTVLNANGMEVVSFDVTEEAKRHAIKVMRAVRRWLSKAEGPIYAMSFNSTLLTKLGFKPSGLSLNGRELWRWQNSQQ